VGYAADTANSGCAGRLQPQQLRALSGERALEAIS